VGAAAMTRRGLPVGPPPSDLGLTPVAEESPFLRRKVRSRPRPRPRRRGWSIRLLIGLQALTILLLMVAGTWTVYRKVMGSERLHVARVEVQGSHFLSEGEVRELLGPAVGENILSLDIDALKARLRSSPWVADATVTRTLPDTVRVDIHERIPLALAEVDRLYLMDGDGALVDIYGPRTGVFDLPIVRGLLGVDESSRRDRARRAGLLLSDLAELGQEVSEVFVEPNGDLRVVLRGPGEVLLFGDPPYRQRFVTFLSLRRELAEKAPDAEHFDLRFRGRIYARHPHSPAARAAVASDDPTSRPLAGTPPPSAPGVSPSLPAGETHRPTPTPWGSPTRPATTSHPEARGASFPVPANKPESRRAASASGALRR
jgi:cell division protein FtsQ